jgi:lipoate-protein ligase A
LNTVWRLLDTPPARGAWNMALDESLMESVRGGSEPVLRFYRWSPACLSLGRNQPAAGLYDERAIRERGLDVVRRPTGGRAVLHEHELTYSAIFPDRALGSPRYAYAAINRAFVAGLRRLGVDARIQPRSDRPAPSPSIAPCFRDPAEGEVMVDGRKLIGSAQCRERGVILQHGSLLLSGDQTVVSDLLLEPPSSPDGQAANGGKPPAVLADHLTPLPDWADLTAAVIGGWTDTFGAVLTADAPSASELDRVETISAARYAASAWTWRL